MSHSDSDSVDEKAVLPAQHSSRLALDAIVQTSH